MPQSYLLLVLHLLFRRFVQRGLKIFAYANNHYAGAWASDGQDVLEIVEAVDEARRF